MTFLPPPVPLMSAVKARDLARECQGMANHLRERGATGEANILERRSAWWMAYSVADPAGAGGYGRCAMNHESVYVYALQRVLCLAEAHKADDDTQRLRAAMAEITTFIDHVFAELDQLSLEQRR